jgi:hypothetical protein
MRTLSEIFPRWPVPRERGTSSLFDFLSFNDRLSACEST